MRIPEMYERQEPTISFEFFPPKDDEAEQALFRDTVPGLKRLSPAFISVTYHASGGSRKRTFRIVDRLRKQYGIEAMAHLTCVGVTRADCGAILDEAEALGMENILALRGDPPKDQPEFRPTEGGFRYASDLIRFVKGRGCFSVGAAGYPEGHLECPDKLLDWDRSALKIEAGAEYLITQLFYDVEDFLAYEDYLRNKRHVKAPIIPGIMPFLSTGQIKRITGLCGSKLPEGVQRRMETLGDDESVRKLGVEVCTELCRRLLDHGVPGIHFYCLNRVTSCAEVIATLGLA
ncbi:MAG TPA: methylenetetrahydrofolate reductase [NAD(P)H] [Gemmataceae bacterium]|nr:methylenetetrahydrofolate reductase [NAD(P)H] [Gemmataceae bacterium]